MADMGIRQGKIDTFNRLKAGHASNLLDALRQLGIFAGDCEIVVRGIRVGDNQRAILEIYIPGASDEDSFWWAVLDIDRSIEAFNSHDHEIVPLLPLVEWSGLLQTSVGSSYITGVTFYRSKGDLERALSLPNNMQTMIAWSNVSTTAAQSVMANSVRNAAASARMPRTGSAGVGASKGWQFEGAILSNEPCRSGRYSALTDLQHLWRNVTRTPIDIIMPGIHPPMKRRGGPIARPRDILMFHRIEMDVIKMVFQILNIANPAFFKNTSPKTAAATRRAVFRERVIAAAAARVHPGPANRA